MIEKTNGKQWANTQPNRGAQWRWGRVVVSVEERDGEPVVVIGGAWPAEPSDGGRTWAEMYVVAKLLDVDSWGPDVEFEGQLAEWVVPYTDEVDRRIVGLVDLLASVRCSVPHVVQLPLELPIEDAGRLARMLQPRLPEVV